MLDTMDIADKKTRNGIHHIHYAWVVYEPFSDDDSYIQFL